MRYLTAALAVAVLASAARAHFVFVYVADGGAEARVVFGHAAAPDPDSFPTRAEKTTLTARDPAGKDSKLVTEKGDGNFYRAKLPAEKPVVVFGVTEAGVTQRGDNPAMLSWYYPKVIVGDPFARGAAVGHAVPMEVVPERDGEKVRFRVLSGGKPVADAEVTVGLSGADGEGRTVKTDAEGRTDGFAAGGRYCVAARRTEARAGEHAGKKYAAIRHTATVVVDLPAK